jgi:hypothetical protein
LLRGPERYSFYSLLGIRLPRWIAPLGLAAILLTVRYAGVRVPEPPEQEEEAQEEAPEELAGEDFVAVSPRRDSGARLAPLLRENGSFHSQSPAPLEP